MKGRPIISDMTYLAISVKMSMSAEQVWSWTKMLNVLVFPYFDWKYIRLNMLFSCFEPFMLVTFDYNTWHYWLRCDFSSENAKILVY